MALADDFKTALASWATGVSVVTTNEGGMLYGLTVSSFTSVSLEPPLVLVCLGNDNRMARMIEAAGGFAVSLLAADQRDAADWFATPGREPTAGFTTVPGRWTDSGIPVVDDAMAHLVCRWRRSLPEGDHTIVVGEVTEATADPGRAPLLYWRRGYRSVKGA